MVRNYGNVATPVTAVFRIGTFYADTNTLSNLNPGDSNVIWFRQWNIRERGVHAIRCSTMLAGDRDHSNDTCSGSATVRVRDVAATAIAAPGDWVDSGATVTPRAVVRNYGTTQESFAVRFTIGGFYANNQNVSDLLPGDSAVVNFANWQATQMGTHAVACSTMLVGDMVGSNNRIQDTVTVGLRDVATLRIAAPPDTVDSGATVAPRAWVRNLGTAAATFDVQFHIGTGYSNVQNVVSLAAGDSTLVNFTNWTAGPRGQQTTRCSTALAGDARPANDWKTGEVMVRVSDVGVAGIAAPSGQVDSGTKVVPRVKVRNWGNGPASFWARFLIESSREGASIGSGVPGADVRSPTTAARRGAPGAKNVEQLYVDSVWVDVAAGDSTFADFDTWTASPLGELSLESYTELSSDQVRSNDTAHGTVTVRRVVHDVGAVQVLEPVGTVGYGEVVAPKAVVQNFGTSVETFAVRFLIGGFYADDTTATVASQASDTVVFASWTAESTGTHVVRCTTRLDGDAVPENDAVRDSVQVSEPRHDVGAVRILEPVGVVDYGDTLTPKAVVQNFGPVTETFPVRFFIGDFYTDDTTTTVAAHAHDTVVFARWIADTIGTHTVRCTTRLNGDADSSNDAVWDSVVVVAVGVEESRVVIPTRYSLAGASPNPFRSQTCIGFALPHGSSVRLTVFDATGSLVRVLADRPEAPGFRRVTWDGRDWADRLVPSGLYFYRFEAGEFTAVGRVLRAD